jgi:hypothetical protein
MFWFMQGSRTTSTRTMVWLISVHKTQASVKRGKREKQIIIRATSHHHNCLNDNCPPANDREHIPATSARIEIVMVTGARCLPAEQCPFGLDPHKHTILCEFATRVDAVGDNLTETTNEAG